MKATTSCSSSSLRVRRSVARSSAGRTTADRRSRCSPISRRLLPVRPRAVDDGTGELVVWCPAPADPFKAVVVGEHIELDVQLTSGDEKRSSREFDVLAADIGISAMAGDLAGAQAYALELASFLEPAATDALATAARPLGETRWGQTKVRDGYADSRCN